MAKRVVAVLALALVLVLGLGSCKGKGTFSSEIPEEGGAYKVIADDAPKGSAVASLGGGILIEEGEDLLVSPNLSEGSVQLQLINADSVTVIDLEVSGDVLSNYAVDPGDYSVSVTCLENGTTGTVLIFGEDPEELAKQNADLETALESLGMSTESESESK